MGDREHDSFERVCFDADKSVSAYCASQNKPHFRVRRGKAPLSCTKRDSCLDGTKILNGMNEVSYIERMFDDIAPYSQCATARSILLMKYFLRTGMKLSIL